MNSALAEVHSTVLIKPNTNFWLRLFTFTGPAFMVAVGYMDPGNWATDLAGGSRFGYRLIWVILLANLMAILFQALSARLGIVLGRDLAQACRDHYSKTISFILWIICEVAIAACDLAEVLGSAIGLYILFRIPLLYGVLITTFDVLLLMFLMSFGIRKMEAFILALVATIGICFGIEVFFSNPNFVDAAKGLLPTTLNTEGLFISLGIIGATVMPHNLYLHSALVQSRDVKRTSTGLREANKFNFIDSVVALNAAFFVNAAILIVAAAVFFKNGYNNVASIMDAHALLAPLLGSSAAPIIFGIALLAAGQSSTITGTFAGQIVMEGFIGLKMRPWLRRLITRFIAIIPAVIVIKVSGDNAVDSLLILSQVVLSLQLPFAIIPLLHFTSSRKKMGEFASKMWVIVLAWTAAAIITLLNLKYLLDLIKESISLNNTQGILVRYMLIPLTVFLLPLLVWIIVEPIFSKAKISTMVHRATAGFAHISFKHLSGYKKIGVALEGKREKDEQIYNGSLDLIKSMKAEVYLINIVQSVTGRFMGELVADKDAFEMNEYLNAFVKKYKTEGIPSQIIIGGGEPKEEIIRIAKAENLELIIAGSHGHKFISDIIYGSTIDGVRHGLQLPVLAIPVSK
ncbi:MAG: Nramp family divalent metal transporter [Ignavibacteriaceae bacterium]|nr:Nramp family divalent metal transporter [Ignavibacteriaceae bacterium]